MVLLALCLPLFAAPQEAIRPEDLRVRVISASTESSDSVHPVLLETRAELPDGSPWGRGLAIQAVGSRLAYEYAFLADVFTWPAPEAGTTLPAAAEIGPRGDVEILCLEPRAPGLWDVEVALDPALQRNPAAWQQLLRDLRLSRLNGLPRTELLRWEGWAGAPEEVVPGLADDLREYWRILRAAREAYDRVRAREAEASAEDWLERIGPDLQRLRDLRDDAARRRESSLLRASFGFLCDALADAAAAAETLRDRAEERDRRGGAAGEDPFEGASPDEIPGSKDELPAGAVTPRQAASFPGALRLDRMEELLDRAPAVGLREALLWNARAARRGVDETRAASDRRDTAARALCDAVRPWRECARRMPEALEGLASAADRESRRYRENGWDRLFDGAAALWDDASGLAAYADAVLDGAEPETRQALREALETSADGVEGRLRAVPLHPRP